MIDAPRRLLWHGMMLVLIGLLNGISLQSYATPRLALAAHVGTIMNGMLVAVIGLLWERLAQSPAIARLLFWSTVGSGYINWAGLFLAGVFGTSQATPLLGAGHAGTIWQEAAVTVLLVVGGLGVLIAIALTLYGLRSRR